MSIEEKLPDIFKRNAYRPDSSTCAWKKKDLEKLFEELNMSNIALHDGEVWLVEEEIIQRLIPLNSGEIKVFRWNIEQNDNEEWADFAERSTKETLNLINNWNLEKTARSDIRNKIWYYFKFVEER